MPTRHISGFEYLRATFSILIVIWHANAMSFFGKIQPTLQPLIEVFHYNICLLGVPIFLQISLFLFYKKQFGEQNYFFKKRLPNLLFLYSIWMLLGISLNLLISNGKYLLEIGNIRGFLTVLVMGSRPELFFLFSLIFVTCLAFANTKILAKSKNSLHIQSILLVFSLMMIGLSDWLTFLTHNNVFSIYWNPICFVPYVFSSSILVLIDQKEISNFFRKKAFSFTFILCTIFLGMSLLEWRLLNFPDFLNSHTLPPYARVSLVFGAFTICYWATFFSRKPPILIQKLSQESLGIYLLHVYVLELVVGVGKVNTLFGVIFNPIINAILAMTIPIFLSGFFKKYKIGRIMLSSSSK